MTVIVNEITCEEATCTTQEGFEEVEIKFDETAERCGGSVEKQTQMYLTVAAQILAISF